jgi:hypothetical protein
MEQLPSCIAFAGWLVCADEQGSVASVRMHSIDVFSLLLIDDLIRIS